MTRSGLIAAIAGTVAATAAALALMGRPMLCRCGRLDLWGQVGPEQSQMLADWYSPSHVIHGILFFAAARLLFLRLGMPLRFLLALVVEAGWELLENTPLIIDRYREATMALGYTGDSIVNSLSDIAMMAVGYFLAMRLPLWASVAVVVLLELAALAAVRDNLTLNIMMLVAPNETILEWQSRA